MNNSNKNNDLLLKLSLIFYFLILLIFFLVSFFPEGRAWGVSFWGYFPKYIPIILFLVGLLVPVGLWLSQKSKEINTPDFESKDSNTTYFIIAGVIVVVFGLLFYFFRATNHFLGDGYQNLVRLTENPLVKPREMGETMAHIWVKSLFSSKEGGVAALLSYQVISIGTGVIFMIVTAMTAARLFKPKVERLLYFLGVISGGFVLLFFGYVENYSMFVLSVGVFCQVGLLIACHKLSRWWSIPITALAIFFHILGVTLLPAFVYLIISGSKLGDILSRLNNKLKIICALVVLAALFMVFSHYYSNSLYFRFAFIPPLATRFTVEGYTLFSLKHIADYLNLWMVLLPSFGIFIVLLFFVPLSSLIKKREYRFLIVLFLSTAGAVFIFDPKIGMPRDWDLFSFAGIPAAVLGYYALLNNRKHIKYVLMLAVVAWAGCNLRRGWR